MHMLLDDCFREVDILVIGVGNGGNRAVDAMFSDVDGVDFIAVNTDSFALEKNYAETKIQIGEKILKGLGTNGNIETGRKAAKESLEIIEKAAEDYDMVLIVAGMGGGTGGGAAPVIASAIKKKGILTIGVVTKPFLFEGTKRMQNAENGINELKENVDTLIVIPNQKLIESEDKDIDSLEAFRRANRTLKHCVAGIAYLVVRTGIIGVDFADVRSLMARERVLGSVGIGYGKVENNKCNFAAYVEQCKLAAEAAYKSPLLEVPLEKPKCVIINVIGDENLGILERNKVAEFIDSHIAPDAEVILSNSFVESSELSRLDCNASLLVVIIAK